MGEPNKPGGKASKVFPQRRSACMQRFPGAAESDTGCSDPELCRRCSAECGNEHAAECSRVRQSAAGSAVAAAVVQPAAVVAAACSSSSSRPEAEVQSTPGRGCSPLCSERGPPWVGVASVASDGGCRRPALHSSCSYSGPPTPPAVHHAPCTSTLLHWLASIRRGLRSYIG